MLSSDICLRVLAMHRDDISCRRARTKVLRQSHRPRRLKVSAYYTAQARVNCIALSMDHVGFRNALLRDLSPFAYTRRVTSVGNDPYRGAPWR
jgi:hypothetical protein